MKSNDPAVEANEASAAKNTWHQPFIRQVEDDSLPAALVLVLQMHGRDPLDPSPVFVP